MGLDVNFTQDSAKLKLAASFPAAALPSTLSEASFLEAGLKGWTRELLPVVPVEEEDV